MKPSMVSIVTQIITLNRHSSSILQEIAGFRRISSHVPMTLRMVIVHADLHVVELYTAYVSWALDCLAASLH